MYRYMKILISMLSTTGCTHFADADRTQDAFDRTNFRLEYLEKEVRVAQCSNVLNYCLHTAKEWDRCQPEYEQCVIRIYGKKEK